MRDWRRGAINVFDIVDSGVIFDRVRGLRSGGEREDQKKE
jgi:hypothetical protein